MNLDMGNTFVVRLMIPGSDLLGSILIPLFDKNCSKQVYV